MPSKRYKKALEQLGANRSYSLKTAVEVLAKFPKAKFNETIDLAFRLGVDPKQSDQMVRGTVPLPHGSGTVPRTIWSDCLGSTPRRKARSTVSLNFAFGNLVRTSTAAFSG